MNNFKLRTEAYITHITAKYIWPLIRFFIKKSLSKRCSHCVLSEKAVEICDDGICEQCHEFNDNLQQQVQENTNSVQNIKQIDKLLKNSVGKGSQWDAILLFSGGKDSTYLLNELKETYPDLRLLALLVDTGFMSPIALENAKTVLSHFNIDYLKYDVSKRFIKKTFNKAFKLIKQQGNYSLVDLVDGEIIFDSARNFAAKFGAPLVICGLAKNQVENVYGDIGVEFTEAEELNPLTRYCDITLDELYDQTEMSYWFDRSKFKKKDIPRFILPMIAWDPSEQEIVEKLSKLKLLDKNKTSPLLTNNAMIPVIAIAEVNIFGYTSFEVEFSKTIREGKAPREYWLNIFQMMEYAGKTGKFVGKTIKQVLKELELTKSDIGMK